MTFLIATGVILLFASVCFVCAASSFWMEGHLTENERYLSLSDRLDNIGKGIFLIDAGVLSVGAFFI